MRPTYNAQVQGFNQNGLVIVQLYDGSVTTARQTGNGVLSVGQPVVFQASSSAGIANVCFDPAARPAETRAWPVEPEAESDADFDIAFDRETGGSRLTNSLDQTLSYNSLVRIASGTDRWLKVKLDVLLRFGRMTQSGPWTYAYDPGYFYDNDAFVLTLNNDRTVTVLKARRRMRVKSVTVSSNWQPGGLQADPSRSGASSTPEYTQLSTRRQFFELAVLRAGIETQLIDNAVLFSLGQDLNNYALLDSPSTFQTLTEFSNTFLAAQPYRLKTVAQFVREAGNTNTDLRLSYSAVLPAEDQLLAKGDLLIMYSTARYYYWQPGNTPWKLTRLEVT